VDTRPHNGVGGRKERVVANCPEEDLIRKSVAALNAGDVEGYLAGFSGDSVRWVSGLDTPLTLNDIRANLVLLTTAFDRLHLHEDLLFGARGHVCARWTLRGIHVGDYGGIAPTHREIAVKNCEVYAFAGGTVSESWAYGDATGIFDQLKQS
jgi:predicted ester cyclase